MENKIAQIKELADWMKDNGEVIKNEGKSIFIGMLDNTEEDGKVTISFVGTAEGLMVFHEALEDAIKENADDLLKYFLKKIMED